jgi:hypothetical protein
MIKKYNEQCDVINELQNERKFYKKELLLWKTTRLTISTLFVLWERKLKILETTLNYIRNVRKLITSLFKSSIAN